MRVVILGGGAAGWMAAAALSQYFGRHLSVTLIESEAIGIVGVGEATIPQIRLFNAGLGIDERDFLKRTSGTMKLGIEFVNWRKPGHRYFHGFGEIGRAVGMIPFHHYWMRYRAEGGERGLDAFSPSALAAAEGRYGPPPGKGARLPAAAYHMDATVYAAFLRNYAEARGVVRREGVVRDWSLHPETGHITTLTLQDGAAIPGDLFIDCSGFRGVLIEQALQTGYQDWSHWLPCDRALAMPSEGDGRLAPFTRSTAEGAGWRWEIPLRHRTGAGHVYASAFIDDDAALRALEQGLPGAPLGDPRALRFQTGKRRKVWNRNCVALGLASGFLEPLESTSIHLIQAGIAKLLALFPTGAMDPGLAAEFNRQMEFEFQAVRDFLILHYHVTERADTEFWRYCRAMSIPDSLREKLDLFTASGRIMRFNSELFDIPSWFQVMWGQGLRPAGHHPMVNAASATDLARHIARSAQETRAQVDGLARHADHIARINAAPSEP